MGHQAKGSIFSKILHLADFRHWTFVLLPVAVGTTLPFWLDPAGFSFKWMAAIEFLLATTFFYSGFSLIKAGFEKKTSEKYTTRALFITGIVCLMAALLIGLHLNNDLHLSAGVHPNIFLLYGALSIFIGILYIVPPFSFNKRIGGEIVISVGLGMMPVIGAFLIQAGDLHRTVYLASIPLVISTGLWVWITELINRREDEKAGYTTMVMLFPPLVSGRYLTLLISFLVYASIVLAVFGRSSLNPLSLAALVSIVLAIRIVIISWTNYSNSAKMLKAKKYAFFLHLTVSIIIVLSSLSELMITYEI